MSLFHTILVFGLSGTGKSQIAHAFAKGRSDVVALSASSVLAERLKESPDKLRSLSAEQIIQNQCLLVESFRRERQRHQDCHLLLEVHAIIDNDTGIVPVSTEIVRGLNPTALVFLEADPSQLEEVRRNASKLRPHRSREVLESHQSVARSLVQEYASELSLPLCTVQAYDEAAFASTLSALLDVS